MWFTVTVLERLLLSATPVVLLHEHIVLLATSIQAASVHVMCHLLVSHGSRGVHACRTSRVLPGSKAATSASVGAHCMYFAHGRGQAKAHVPMQMV